MNSYVKAALVILAAVLGAYGTAMASSADVVHWNSVWGAVASSAASAILGIFTNLPRSEWTDSERAVKLGSVDETKP